MSIRTRLQHMINMLSGITNIVLIIVLIIEVGFKLSTSNPELFHIIHNVIFGYFSIDIILRLLFQRRRLSYLLKHPGDIFIAWPLIQSFSPILSPILFSQIALIFILVGRITHITNVFKALKINPAQLLLLGFLLTIFIGSLLLSLPFATINPAQFHYIDALFTSTSAVCVTGLVTTNVHETFTSFGQSIILGLIQIGGLGIMAFSAILVLLIKKKFSMKENQEFKETYATVNSHETFQIIKAIFGYTFLFELIGGVILFFFWRHTFETIESALFASAFHAVSAFCNAGFSTFENSLSAFSDHTGIMLTISALVIFGGLGFPVILDILRQDSHPGKLKLQSKITLTATLFLLILGSISILLTEWSYSLSELPQGIRLLNAFFQSVSARTAGFNTIDIGEFQSASLLMMISLMFIGASPGSTGGGIKTTTFGVLIIGLFASLRGDTTARLFNRSITQENIMRALALITISMIMISSFLFAFLLSENMPFIASLFEIVSAFSTVGLSTGITEHLSNIGKGIIMVVMFIGRVGPLTVALAFSGQRKKRNFDYPEESVLIT